jgi:hypothetical protein
MAGCCQQGDCFAPWSGVSCLLNRPTGKCVTPPIRSETEGNGGNAGVLGVQ